MDMGGQDRKVAIVTGGSQGIGAGLVAAYRRLGWAVVATSRTIASVLDDDPAVVAVLEADGWPVELATWLPHSSTLQNAQEQQGRT